MAKLSVITLKIVSLFERMSRKVYRFREKWPMDVQTKGLPKTPKLLWSNIISK